MYMVDTTEATAELPNGSDSGVATEASEPVQPQTFTITVNGVPVEKTLDELTEGFMLKQDYTRKTQTLASQRSELEQATNLYKALQADPEETLKTLARSLGVESFTGQDDEYDDPTNQKLKVLEREIERLNQTEANRKIDGEVSALKSKYQVSDDQMEDVFAHAVKHSFNLQAAYRDLFFDEAQEALAAVKARKAAEATIAESKVKASVVHLGTSSAGRPDGSTTAVKPKNFKEAYLLARDGILYTGE